MHSVTEMSKRCLPLVGCLAMTLGFVNCDRNHAFSRQEDQLVISTQPVANVIEQDQEDATPTSDVESTPTNGIDNYEVIGNNDGNDELGAGSGSANQALTVSTSVNSASTTLRGTLQTSALMVSLQGESYNTNWDLLTDNSDTEKYAALKLKDTDRGFATFASLRVYDENGDQRIDSKDAQFSNLRLEIPSSTSAGSALLSLEGAGIESISLQVTNVFGEQIDDILIENKAVVRFTDSNSGDGIVRRGIIFEKIQ